MIGTHAVKMLNARLRQPGLRARIIHPDQDVVSSASTNLHRELWALPNNAADMGRELTELARSSAQTFVREIPSIADPGLKQLLLPMDDWRNGAYVSTTPVASMGLAHEIYRRLYARHLPSHRFTVQPNPVALANHGEALMRQGGEVRLLRRGVAQIHGEGQWSESVVIVSGRVERMNIGAGMLAQGWPAMTAIGGMVHALERKTGCDIDFAFAMQDVRYIANPLHSVAIGSSQAPPRSQGNRVRAGRRYGHVSAGKGYQLDEVLGNGTFMLLLRCTRADLSRVASEAKQIRRLAGGSVFGLEVNISRPGEPREAAAFLLDASVELQRRPSDVDALDVALDAYAGDGEWKEAAWYQSRNGYTLNMCGYAWLEDPVRRTNVRGNYPHAWSEPMFSLVTQGSLTPCAWWRRNTSAGGVRWRGVAMDTP